MPFGRSHNKKGVILLLTVIIASVLTLLYLTSLLYRSHELYKYLMTEHKRGWEGLAFQADDELGFKPRPNTKAFRTFPLGDKIPLAFDENGFRIPLSGTSKANRPDKTNLLFLGCSFTYGEACRAEETFPFLVARETGLSYINAGVCGYGLAHMLILAEKLIPRYKPDFVVMQYSPWLVERSTRLFTPVDFGSLPGPYFADKETGLCLAPPAYRSQIVDKDGKRMKSLYQGKFIEFFFREGLGFYLYEDWHFLKTGILLKTGYYLRPAADDPHKVEEYAYNRIRSLAEENGAAVIILNLGDINYSRHSRELFSGPNVHFAEADIALDEFLRTSPSKDYTREFGHWESDGEHDILVDPHPNSKAHRIIAGSIIREINEISHKPGIRRSGRVEH
jgi:hypothetical protein